jgi:hypothetical protein
LFLRLRRPQVHAGAVLEVNRVEDQLRLDGFLDERQLLRADVLDAAGERPFNLRRRNSGEPSRGRG